MHAWLQADSQYFNYASSQFQSLFVQIPVFNSLTSFRNDGRDNSSAEACDCDCKGKIYGCLSRLYNILVNYIMTGKSKLKYLL